MNPWVTLSLGFFAGLAFAAWLRRWGSRGSGYVRVRPGWRIPANTQHVLDLLCRAQRVPLVCLVQRSGEPMFATAGPALPNEAADRAVAAALRALEDGMKHVQDEGQPIVAVGDGRRGVAVVLSADRASPEVAETIAAELRDFLGELVADSERNWNVAPAPQRGAFGLQPELDTLPAVATGLCDRARIISGRSTAVVSRDSSTQNASIVAISHNADRRLIGNRVSPDSAAGRACLGNVPVTTGMGDELLGDNSHNRRRRDQEGIVYPLRDGADGIGALVVFGPDDMNVAVRERLESLVLDASPSLAVARAATVAERRSLTDALTGLANRAALDQAMMLAPLGPCALLHAEIDDFNQVKERLGGTASDGALKHIARILRAALRDEDVPAKVGDAEFLLWLPSTDADAASAVGERVRGAVENTRWAWAGGELQLTCSIGMAARKDVSRHVSTLLPASASALQHAKRAGGNKVVDEA